MYFLCLKRLETKLRSYLWFWLKTTYRSANIPHISEFICVFIAVGSCFQAVACSMFSWNRMRYWHLTCSIINAHRRKTLRLSTKKEKPKHFLSYNLLLQTQVNSSHLFMFHLLTDSTDCDRFILSRSIIFMNGGRVLFCYVTSNDTRFLW